MKKMLHDAYQNFVACNIASKYPYLVKYFEGLVQKIRMGTAFEETSHALW